MSHAPVERAGRFDLVLRDEAQRVRGEVQAHADRVEDVVVGADVVADAQRVDLAHLQQPLACITRPMCSCLVRTAARKRCTSQPLVRTHHEDDDDELRLRHQVRLGAEVEHVQHRRLVRPRVVRRVLLLYSTICVQQ